jgi:hypothetical protein
MAGVTFKERVAPLEHLVAHMLQTTAQENVPKIGVALSACLMAPPLGRKSSRRGGGCQRKIACRRVHDPARYCPSLALRGVSRRGTMIRGLP